LFSGGLPSLKPTCTKVPATEALGKAITTEILKNLYLAVDEKQSHYPK
jgi:hypothetical protein